MIYKPMNYDAKTKLPNKKILSVLIVHFLNYEVLRGVSIYKAKTFICFVHSYNAIETFPLKCKVNKGKGKIGAFIKSVETWLKTAVQNFYS